ncbi:MAG: hypothetical protein JKY67_23045 [Pseudomonadales bacterium]|nr:hypothetical protein [Pseudomonadales bacterium]
MKDYFFQLCELVSKDIDDSFKSSFFLTAEDSQFIRFSKGKVRQSGIVKDASVSILLGKDQKELSKSRRLTNHLETDVKNIKQALREMVSMIGFIPVNPFSIWPEEINNTENVYEGNLINRDETVKKIVGDIGNIDLVGIYAGGKIYRGQVNSFGQKNWFESTNFNFDFSVYASNGLADKHSLSGECWDEKKYQDLILQSKDKVTLLEEDKKDIVAGKYDIYFSPAAVTDVVEYLNYGAFSKSNIEDKCSSFCQLMDKKVKLSNKVNLSLRNHDDVIEFFYRIWSCH